MRAFWPISWSLWPRPSSCSSKWGCCPRRGCARAAAFAELCPNIERTKKVLLPSSKITWLLQQPSTLTNGALIKSYQQLASSITGLVARIEGRLHPYNLDQYPSLYLWFQYNKKTRLIPLVKINNSNQVMNSAQGIVPDTEGFDYSQQEKEAEAAEMARLDEGMEFGSGSGVWSVLVSSQLPMPLLSQDLWWKCWSGWTFRYVWRDLGRKCKRTPNASLSGYWKESISYNTRRHSRGLKE